MGSITSDIEPAVEPAAVGFDASRLGRIAAHLDRYVDDGRLPGVSVLLTRGGQIAYTHRYGQRDCERSLPVTPDTIYRIYSMTKPIVSIAAMQLYEQGFFQLKDPVSRWIPEFANARVFAGGNVMQDQTREPASALTVHSLLTHTSGLTYDFHFANEVDALYRANGFNWGAPGNLEETCEALAALPLLFDPGTEWNYSYSTDVLGRVVELASGQSLDEYLIEHVTGPLGMVDTGFEVPPADVERFAANYTTAALAARDPAGNTGPTVPAYRADDPGLARLYVAMHNLHRPTAEALLQIGLGELDLGILSVLDRSFHSALGTGIESVILAEEDWVILAPIDHELAGHQAVSLDRIRNEPLILFPRPYALRTVIDEAFARAGISVEPTIETGWLATAVRCVELGLGISLVPRAVTMAQEAEVAVLDIDEPVIPRRVLIALYRSDSARADLTERFLALLGRHPPCGGK